MIKINNLPKEERKELSRNVESFFPMYKKQIRFKPQFKFIKGLCKGNCDKEVWTYITAISKAIRYGNKKTYMSFDSKVYNKASTFTKHPINCQKMVNIARVLEEQGYIIKYTGFKFDGDSSLSILILTEKLLNLFDEEVCKKFGSERNMSYIEMYDTHYKIVNGREVKYKELISLKGKLGFGKCKISLSAFNKVVDGSIITVEGEVRNDVLYKRVFEKSFLGAGRYYTFGSFQTLTKEQRRTICINGNATYAEDYVAVHPNVIRTWKGIQEPVTHDPYTINLSKNCDIKELRKLCKVGLMCLLYNRSRGKAIQALTSKITKDKFVKVDGKRYPRPLEDQKYKSLHKYRGIASEIVSKLVELNSDIASEFFQEDLWYRLQNVDSRLAEYVIGHFTDKNVCVLPWHDSFRIEVKYKSELKAIMKEAWMNVLGDLTHCKTTEE
jgi:hypothetical protein